MLIDISGIYDNDNGESVYLSFVICFMRTTIISEVQHTMISQDT